VAAFAADSTRGHGALAHPENGSEGSHLERIYRRRSLQHPQIPRVGGIRGIPISITAPTDGQVLQYSATARKWKPVHRPAAQPAARWRYFLGRRAARQRVGQTRLSTCTVPSNEILTTGSKFRLVWKSTTNTFIVGAAVVRRTLAGSSSFVDSTAITWGGINPTFTGTPRPK
jgi:hypothetical protein